MAFSEVDNMDEVAAAGTIGSVVIVAVDGQLGELVCGDFHDDRHEIVGDAVW